MGGLSHLLEQSPCSAVVDSFGNLVVAYHGLQIVAAKSGTFYGRKMTAGSAYHVMQSSNCAGARVTLYDLACAVDVVADRWGNLVVSFSASHGRSHPKPAAIDVAPARSGTFYGIRMTAGRTYRLVSGGGAQLAPDRAGNLLVAGDGTNRVGVIAGKAGRFYGREMKAGKLYDIAGTGKAGFSGDDRRFREPAHLGLEPPRIRSAGCPGHGAGREIGHLLRSAAAGRSPLCRGGHDERVARRRRPGDQSSVP